LNFGLNLSAKMGRLPVLRRSQMNRRELLSVSAVLAFAPALTCAAGAKTTDGLRPIVTGLDHPWGMAFLPDGTALVTERRGQLRRIDVSARTLGEPMVGLPDVAAEGQGGLLDVVLDPAFSQNRRIYLTFAEQRDGGAATAVYRARLSEDHTRLDDGSTIFRQNVAADGGRHFGARLVFDRDGHLFVTTGDRGYLSNEAQNPASHIGKVLRITTDGAAAPGNPIRAGWAPEVWSLGHRNIQGAVLHPETGQLWTAEHGARGGDEINTPQGGQNHGWPVITFGRDYSGEAIGSGTAQDGMEQPLHYWDPSIAPSGMAFVTGTSYPAWSGNLLVGALAGQHVARLTLSGRQVTAEEKMFEGFARIRDVVQAPDGYVYVLTDESAPDGGLYQIAPGGEAAATGSN
jgi:aldose sugar dehydrogenase